MPAFNPLNPYSYLQLWNPYAYAARPSVFPVQPRLPAGTPIAIKPRNSDPGLTIEAGRDSVTLRGNTEGAQVVRDLSGYVKYEVARGVSFSLDVDKAPTVDLFGDTDYTAKNHRSFGIDTAPGWSAASCAQMLADKVNSYNDFRASVKKNADGSATIEFRRW